MPTLFGWFTGEKEPSPFEAYEQKLGDGARLAVNVAILNQDNTTTTKGYKNSIPMPMASTSKLALSLCVLYNVFETKSLSLDQVIAIDDTDYSPGPPLNPLDRFYFELGKYENNYSIDELLTFMHEHSDNTATDKLLTLVGGPEKVNELMTKLGLDGYLLCSNSKELLSAYYQVPAPRTLADRAMFLDQFMTAYTMRETERGSLFTEGKDSCTANFMTSLLLYLLDPCNATSNPWLKEASEIIQAKMLLCQTGVAMIGKASEKYSDQILSIGDKTGSLGGILNDEAFIKLKDGRTIIISIYSCFSTVTVKENRETIIADLATSILDQIFAPQLQAQAQNEFEAAERAPVPRRSSCALL